MAAKSLVTLSDNERTQLLTGTKKGAIAARPLPRAHILLQAAAGAPDGAVAAALPLGPATVERTRTRFVEEGLDAAWRERPRPGGCRKLEGQQEACLMALACSTPPDGRTHWTRPLLADKLVERKHVESISDETVRRTRQKTR
jgi:Homeodomain-like domain